MSNRVSVTIVFDINRSLDEIGKERLREQLHKAVLKMDVVDDVHMSTIDKIVSSKEVRSLGGLARAEKLSPEERTAIAIKAANARWKKEKNSDE